MRSRLLEVFAVLACLFSLASLNTAEARNYPCSGKKGGVSHCAGETFVCNDGSVSASKKICSMGGESTARALVQQPRSATSSSECSCRSGAVCTGPRGGRYCYSDSGRKSYLRR